MYGKYLIDLSDISYLNNIQKQLKNEIEDLIRDEKSIWVEEIKMKFIDVLQGKKITNEEYNEILNRFISNDI